MRRAKAARLGSYLVGLLITCALGSRLDAVVVEETSYSPGRWGIAFSRWGAQFTVGGSYLDYYKPGLSGSVNIGATDLRAMVAAPDGTVWVTEPGANRIWHCDLGGAWPPITVSGEPREAAIGLDNNVWFTEFSGNKIGRINHDGSISEFPVPTPSSGPTGITFGGDGNVWFTEFDGNKIGRITPSGDITEYPLPAAGGYPTEIASSDSELAIVEVSANKIAFFSLYDDQFENEKSIPTAGAAPQGITLGPDGRFWFVEYYGNKIGRAESFVPIQEFPIPTAGSGPRMITLGPDGDLWFTEQDAWKLGHVAFHESGDANGDGAVDVSDVFYLIDYLFAGGPAPK